MGRAGAVRAVTTAFEPSAPHPIPTDLFNSAMPTKYDEDSAPIIQFDAKREISPFLVFRRLREGKPVALIDVRKEPKGYTLEGSEQLTAEFEPPADYMTVMFDDDGTLAIDVADAFQERGHSQVKALFGGLELWKFSLDPNVVGEHTYLIELPEPAE